MFDDLTAYYHENVVASFIEYLDICNDGVAGRSRDLRAALAAASALFHLREHLPTGSLSRTDVERFCPDYALLGDVVNASKHKALHRAACMSHAVSSLLVSKNKSPENLVSGLISPLCRGFFRLKPRIRRRTFLNTKAKVSN